MLLSDSQSWAYRLGQGLVESSTWLLGAWVQVLMLRRQVLWSTPQPWDNICNKVDKSWQDNIHCLFPIMSFKYCHHHIPLERSLLGRTRHIYIQLTCSLLHKVAQNSLPVFDQVKMKCFLFFEIIFSRVYFSDNYRLSFTKLPFPTLKYSITF